MEVGARRKDGAESAVPELSGDTLVIIANQSHPIGKMQSNQVPTLDETAFVPLGCLPNILAAPLRREGQFYRWPRH